MTMLDGRALEQARRVAGLLPSRLARDLKWSVDRLTAITAGAGTDHDVTLADLRCIAQSLAITPADLLSSPLESVSARNLGAQLASVLLQGRERRLSVLALRLDTTNSAVLDAVDLWNGYSDLGLKIIVRDERLALVADPWLELPEPRPGLVALDPDAEPAAADRLLWNVIDRKLPNPGSCDVDACLMRLASEGLICQLDADWRPSDVVIDSLQLPGWDKTELIDYARGRSVVGLA